MSLAIERYIREEEAFIASVQQGMEDVTAGRVDSTDEMRSRLRALATEKAASDSDA